MPTTITVHLYSGLDNPTCELTSEQEEALAAKLSRDRSRTFRQSPASAGRLGYRGIEIRSTGDSDVPLRALSYDGVLDIGETDEANFIDQDSDLESFLLDFATDVLDDDERDYIQAEIAKNASGGPATSISEVEMDAVPPFNPGKWNNDPHIKRNNNCYNYANDKVTNTFAQPGRGSGAVGSFPPSCNGTGEAAVRDGQVSVPGATSTPSEGHFIALVIWPGRDYHWYRLDGNGRWSHKPGQTASRNTDNSGRLITSPETCDRGPYTQFCGYFHCIPVSTRIR